MALARKYYSVDGEIHAELRVGETDARDYVRDALGNVVAVFQNDWEVALATYDTSGEFLTNFNMSGYKFTWNGSHGYRSTGLEWSSHYVRARHYSFMDGAWTTSDPLWPQEMPYGYVEGMAMSAVDPSGAFCVWVNTSVKTRPCNKAEEVNVQADCDRKRAIAGQTKGKLIKCTIVETTVTCYTCFGTYFTGISEAYIGVCVGSPNGDCTPWRKKALQDDVNMKCKGANAPRSCGSTAGVITMSCSDIRDNLRKFAACAGARARINNECFKGGDYGHIVAFTGAMAGLINCSKASANHVPPC
ncbi:MAG: hypothetical protein KF824_06865 [Fimbriimonadaceae bacterium]|nr:MAG: hypothetical protein KF824_06865 [Fimbriimonadaceae bacterium]